MGKGDRKTRRGKIYRGSHGNSRPHKVRRGTEDAAQGTARKTARRRKTR